MTSYEAQVATERATPAPPCKHCGKDVESKYGEVMHREYEYGQCIWPVPEGHEVKVTATGNCYRAWACSCGALWQEDSSG